MEGVAADSVLAICDTPHEYATTLPERRLDRSYCAYTDEAHPAYGAFGFRLDCREEVAKADDPQGYAIFKFWDCMVSGDTPPPPPPAAPKPPKRTRRIGLGIQLAVLQQQVPRDKHLPPMTAAVEGKVSDNVVTSSEFEAGMLSNAFHPDW